jgi:hypothetical protein
MKTEILLRSLKLRFPFMLALHRLLKSNVKIEKYKNLYKSKSILVVGNGPSLAETPLSDFNIPSIGMNKIDLIFKRTTWRPNFIICNNGLVMLQNKEYFKETNIPILLDSKAMLLNIWSNNIYYFLAHYKKSFSNDFSLNVGSVGTVTYSALQFAYYLGAKRIILVGVDHSFKGYSNKKTHSQIERYKGVDINHFDKDYFKGQLWGLPDLNGSEIGYNHALHFFQSKEIEIFDATIGGALEIFPKISIDDAIELSSLN